VEAGNRIFYEIDQHSAFIKETETRLPKGSALSTLKDIKFVINNSLHPGKLYTQLDHVFNTIKTRCENKFLFCLMSKIPWTKAYKVANKMKAVTQQLTQLHSYMIAEKKANESLSEEELLRDCFIKQQKDIKLLFCRRSPEKSLQGKPTFKVANYSLSGMKLGQGSFGSVYKLDRLIPWKSLAIKVPNPEKQEIAKRDNEKEAKISTEARQYVVTHKKSSAGMPPKGWLCVHDGRTMLVSKCADGDLQQIIIKKNFGDNLQARFDFIWEISEQIDNGEKNFRAHGAIPLDPKPENFLMRGNRVYFGDLGGFIENLHALQPRFTYTKSKYYTLQSIEDELTKFQQLDELTDTDRAAMGKLFECSFKFGLGLTLYELANSNGGRDELFMQAEDACCGEQKDLCSFLEKMREIHPRLFNRIITYCELTL
jgi:hypothetical protein